MLPFRYSENPEAKKSSEESSSNKKQIDQSPLQVNSDDGNRKNNGQLANEVVQQQQFSEFVDLSIPKSVSEQQLQSYTGNRMNDSFCANVVDEDSASFHSGITEELIPCDPEIDILCAAIDKCSLEKNEQVEFLSNVEIALIGLIHR